MYVEKYRSQTEFFGRQKRVKISQTTIHKEEMWYNIDNGFLRVVKHSMIRTQVLISLLAGNS